MGDVVPFQRLADPLDPEAVQHGQGAAFCIACNHTWQAVAPTGTTVFECPSCHAMRGHWKFDFAPDEGLLVSTCPCDNQLFYMTKEGHMCVRCGRYQRYD